jgi:hypothetical protein
VWHVARPAWNPAGEQLDGGHPGGVQIVPRLGWGAGQGLGREVAVGAGGVDARSHRHRDPEVGQVEPGTPAAGGLEQEVGRLDVAVHQAHPVQRREGPEQLLEQDRDVGRREPTVLGEELVDRATAHQRKGEHLSLAQDLGRHEATAVVVPRPPDGRGGARADGVDEPERECVEGGHAPTLGTAYQSCSAELLCCGQPAREPALWT